MIAFFDRDFGIRVPKALQLLRFSKHHELHWHQQHFPVDAPDDDWMPIVGQWGWTVLGHDRNHAVREPELTAIRQYSMGCFSIWGASNTSWEKMQCLARAFDNIVEAEASTPRPFLYDVDRLGRLKQVPLP